MRPRKAPLPARTPASKPLLSLSGEITKAPVSQEAGVLLFMGGNRMQRVMVIGSPGAGKSTFARRLASLTGLPLRHLDAEFWLPGWTERDPAEWRDKQAGLVADDRWIIDGNYGGSLAVRSARADTVILLDYPTALCVWRAVKRIATTHGKVRADSAPDCPEQFNPSFLVYITLFRTRKRVKILRMLEGFKGAVICFACPADAEAWLASLDVRGR